MAEPLRYPVVPRPSSPPQMYAANPDMRTRMVNAMMSGIFGETQQGRDWAERVMGIADMTPAGMLPAAYDAGTSLAQGSPLNAMALAASLAIPGARGRPLAPAQIARRRNALGYGPEVWYHGTPQPGFSQFDIRRLGETSHGGYDGRPAIWVTSHPDVAAMYADTNNIRALRRGRPITEDQPGILPLVVNPGASPNIQNMQGANLNPHEWYGHIQDVAADHMRKHGRMPSSIRLDNVYFSTPPAHQSTVPLQNQTGLASMMVVYDPSQLRMPWARFDPRHASSGNLLAGGAGAALLGRSALFPGQSGSEE